ncbi:hypothetical protein V5799_013307, partial [Amblyomma americanum]
PNPIDARVVDIGRVSFIAVSRFSLSLKEGTGEGNSCARGPDGPDAVRNWAIKVGSQVLVQDLNASGTLTPSFAASFF